MAGKSKGGGKKGGGGKKETSDRVSKIASKGLRGEKLTKSEIRSLSGSALGQDEHKGKRPKK